MPATGGAAIQACCTIGTWRRGYRGLSNTLAGLIILTFALIAVVPLLVDVITGGAQAGLRGAELAAQKLRATAPPLNVTIDPNLSKPPTLMVYRVENAGIAPQPISILVVVDSLNDTYLIRAKDCLSGCTAGASTVTITPLYLVDTTPHSYIQLMPRGQLLVEISNGRLLGVYTALGGYAPAKGQIVTVAVAKYAEYAAVAGGVQTNYFDLSSYQDLSDLINDPNVALVTDPAEDTTDPSILWRNMLQSACYYDGSRKIGGFQPVTDLNKTRLRGVLFFNVQPLAGTFIIGGRDTSYDKPSYEAGMLMHAYSLAPFNDTLPAIVAAVDNDGSWVAVANIYGTVRTFSSSAYSNAINAFRNVIENHMYYSYPVTSGGFKPINGRFQMNVIFDTAGWGLLAWGRLTDNYGYDYDAVIYCPPTGLEKTLQPSGVLTLSVSAECPFIAYWVQAGRFLIGKTSDVTVYINPDGYNETSDGNFTGFYRYASVSIRGSFNEIIRRRGSETSEYLRPFKIKILGTSGQSLIRTYDDARDVMRIGNKAFGHYYYSGNPILDVAHGIMWLGFSNATVTAFEFAPGATSGLEPYTIFVDTDGNGLVEINFITEEFSFGGPNDWDDMNSWPYSVYIHFLDDSDYWMPMGCLDKTLNPLYLKFRGNYAVNGGQIAEVSVQIRYQFHDNAGPDVDDVEDPMQFLMSVRLVDTNGTVYSTSDYIYQQLMVLEDTWPPSTHWVSDSVFLLVPERNETYYIVFALNDPYGWDEEDNDMDFALSVEWLGMWYLYRKS